MCERWCLPQPVQCANVCDAYAQNSANKKIIVSFSRINMRAEEVHALFEVVRSLVKNITEFLQILHEQRKILFITFPRLSNIIFSVANFKWRDRAILQHIRKIQDTHTMVEIIAKNICVARPCDARRWLNFPWLSSWSFYSLMNFALMTKKKQNHFYWRIPFFSLTFQVRLRRADDRWTKRWHGNLI